MKYPKDIDVSNYPVYDCEGLNKTIPSKEEVIESAYKILEEMTDKMTKRDWDSIIDYMKRSISFACDNMMDEKIEGKMKNERELSESAYSILRKRNAFLLVYGLFANGAEEATMIMDLSQKMVFMTEYAQSFSEVHGKKWDRKKE